MEPINDESLIDMKYMTRDTGFTAKYFYSQIKKGKLPKPQKFGNHSRWKYREYKKWKSLFFES
ncbi:helix-turn-helix transcriptional regulator [Xenorhabdus budapestensis]|uniref:Response regulator inhibitor for tor operon n=1 Tax=Xenorhabdus budapestensis TaxID=290110 RepID=A0A2D0IPJ5_XENBU|nr:AlpA family transcriptional regulator [Xenorhabdus budapestensis]PHM23740.1 Response regulator inhibitor for tor operon [Xenorhabdus budapestensis]